VNFLIHKPKELNIYSHVMLGANDINVSKKFYDAVLGTLGYAPGVFDEKAVAFRYRTNKTLVR